MKKSLILFTIPILLLCGCSSKRSGQTSTSEKEPKTAIDYHELEVITDRGRQLTQEEYKQRIGSSYHRSEKFKNVKIIETSDKALHVDDPESMLYGLDHLEYVASLDTSFGDGSYRKSMFDTVISLNFRAYSVDIIGAYRPLRAMSDLEMFLSYAYVYNTYSYYENCLSNEYCILYFDDEFYPQRAEFFDSFSQQTFYFSYHYFNKEDVPTSKVNVDESVFVQSIFAKANHGLNYNAYHLIWDGKMPFPDGTTYIEELDTEVIKYTTIDIHYERFIKLQRLYSGTLLKPFRTSDDYMGGIVDYKDPIYPELNEEQMKYFEKFFEDRIYVQANSEIVYRISGTLIAIVSKGFYYGIEHHKSSSFQLNENIAVLEATDRIVEFHYDDEAYLSNFIIKDRNTETNEFEITVNAKYERSFIL